MVVVNANVDVRSGQCIDTGWLNMNLCDLSEERLGITFVIRQQEFINESWMSNGKTYMQVVLPYDESLEAEDATLIAYQQLYQQLDQVDWLDKELLKNRLAEKMARLN